jgi:hypothetical protein
MIAGHSIALLDAYAWIQQVRPEALPLNPIARWEWVFPVVESIHICGMALLVGTIAILDLRLMGVFFTFRPVSEIGRLTKPWINRGLIIMLLTGPYLLSSDPSEYIQVGAFKVKMCLFLFAIAFHFTIIRRATQPRNDGQPPGRRTAAACMSLLLWTSVMLAGLWIGNL